MKLGVFSTLCLNLEPDSRMKMNTVLIVEKVFTQPYE